MPLQTETSFQGGIPTSTHSYSDTWETTLGVTLVNVLKLFSIMIKIGPKPKWPIVICELVEVAKKIVAVRPAEHPIVGVAIEGNETWKFVLNST